MRWWRVAALVFGIALVGAACGGGSRALPVAVYGDVPVRVGTREVPIFEAVTPDPASPAGPVLPPAQTGVRREPVYAMRRRIVGFRQERAAPPTSDVSFYLGGVLDYRPVPDMGLMEAALALGVSVPAETVDHVIALRGGMAFDVACPNGSLGPGAGFGLRVTYAARFRFGRAYFGPELGLGADGQECDYAMGSTRFVEVLGLGVVGGYRADRWSLGGTLRVGLGSGQIFRYSDPSGALYEGVATNLYETFVLGVETGYAF